MGVCVNSSLETRICSAAMLLGFVLQVVSIASPHWCDSTARQKKKFNFGLWSLCEDIGRPGEHVPICKFKVPVSIVATQVLEVFGLVGTLVTPALVFAATVKVKGKRLSAALSVLSAFLTAIFLITGVTAFGLSIPMEDWKISWTFGFCASAGAIYILVLFSTIVIFIRLLK